MHGAGAGCANTVTWWMQFVVASVYLGWTARPSGLRRRAVLWVERPGLRRWGEFLRLAIPSMLQVCSEAWFWELCVLVVGYLGKVALAAHVTTLSWVTLSTTTSLGLNASTATLVGNALGANAPRKARATAWMCVCGGLLVWAILAFIMVYGKAPLSEFYSEDTEVQDLMQQLLPIFAVAGFCDTMQMVMSGALRGIGLQGVAAATYLTVYYGVMLPGSIMAAFELDMGIFGVWGSFGMGTGLATVVFVLVLCRVDFPRVAAETCARLEVEGLDAEDFASSMIATPSERTTCQSRAACSAGNSSCDLRPVECEMRATAKV